MVEVNEQLMRGVLDVVREGIIAIDPAGSIVLANREAQQIWGYSADELVGYPLQMLFVESDSYRQAAAGERPPDGAPFPLNQRIELRGRSKNGKLFPIEAVVREIETSGPPRFAIIARDLSTRRSTERYLAVEHAVNQLLVSNPSYSTTASQLLQVIGEHFDWELGVFWSIDPAQQRLGCTQIWHKPLVTGSEFKSAVRQMSFAIGEGLPGLVWMSNKPIWFASMLMKPDLPRYKLAAKVGLHAALAFPVRGASGVLGVLEFFSHSIRSLDKNLIETVTTLGNQIGLFLEHKQAEQAMRESDLRKRAILEMALDCIVTINAEGRIIEWNPAAVQTFGYQPEQALGQPIAELIIPPALRQQHQHGMARYLGGNTSSILGKRLELTAVRADGKEFPIELTVTRLPAEGPPIFTGFIRDITERKQAENALRESEERFRVLVQNSSDMIAILDIDGTVRYQSSSVEPILGYQPSELVGTNAFALIHPDDLPKVLEIFSYGLERPGITLSSVYRARHKDGSWRILESIGSNLLDHPAITGVVVNSRDITDRKRAQEALQQYANRLKHLRDLDRAILAVHSPEDMAKAALLRLQDLVPYQRASVTLLSSGTGDISILEIDTDGVVHSVRKEILPSSIGTPACGDGQALEQYSSGFLAAEQGSSSIQVPLCHEESLIGNLTLLAEAPGAFTAEHTTIARDVAAHLELTLQQARLLKQVRASHQRMQSLSRQLLQTQERERRRISRELHDQVGQSLTAVKMNIQATQRLQKASEGDSLLEETIRIIDSVLREIRDLSLDLRPLVLDDLGLVSAVRWYTGRLAQRSGLKVHFAADPGDMPLPSDVETTCFRVIQEALTNVARYAQAQSVSIKLQQRDDNLYLLIRDDGVGFDVREAQERATRGMSLGLLGMQERVELVSGQITIESTAMQGTEVRVKFPLELSASSTARDQGKEE